VYYKANENPDDLELSRIDAAKKLMGSIQCSKMFAPPIDLGGK
jgi:hypothetical protein